MMPFCIDKIKGEIEMNKDFSQNTEMQTETETESPIEQIKQEAEIARIRVLTSQEFQLVGGGSIFDPGGLQN